MAEKTDSKEGLVIRRMIWRDVKDFDQLVRKQQRALQRVTKAAENLDDDEALEKAEAEAEKITQKMQDVLVRYVQSVPADWLGEDAPKDLKFEKGADLDWLLGDRIRIISDTVTGRRADEDSKN